VTKVTVAWRVALFAASSEDVVRQVGRLVEVPFDRIVESVLVGFGEQPRADR
jgi:hypothetical protein